MNAVPDVKEPQPSTALTVVEQARQALKSEQTERDFRALVEQSRTITGITNGDAYKQCHSARMALVRARTTLGALDKKVREDLVTLNKATIAECKRLTAIVEPEEKRLQEIQDAWDAKVAAEKRAREAAERSRVAAIKERIDNDIRGAVLGATGRPAADIARIISDIDALQIDETFAEFQKEAEGAKASTLIRLRMLHAATEKTEAEALRLAEERERLARERAEQEAAAAKERERIAEQQRRERAEAAAQAARLAEELRQQREAQEAAAAKERQRIEEENRQAQLRRQAEEREHQARLQRQREESERQEAERRRVLDEEERAAAQRREAEEARLAAERAEVERQQEALRVQQEAVAKPSDPVEATEQEDVTLVVVEGPSRPSDAEIIDVVAEEFEVSAVVAAGWIAEMGICRG